MAAVTRISGCLKRHQDIKDFTFSTSLALNESVFYFFYLMRWGGGA